MRKEGTIMDIDLLFKIAAIGIIVAVLHQVLVRAGRPGYDDNIDRFNHCFSDCCNAN